MRYTNRIILFFYMSTYLSALAAIYVSMLVMDGIWLSTMMKPFYGKYLGHLLSGSVNFGAATVFYLLYGVGVLVLAVMPILKNNGSLAQAFMMGAFLGLIAYGTYDLTNHATLKDWKVVVTVVDMAWGALLTGVAAAVGVAAARYFG